MNIDLQINQAKQDIINAINKTNLPISIISIILDNLTNQIHMEENRILQEEQQKEAMAKEKAKQQESEVTTD